MDQDGDVIDILVQPRRDQRAAERFFRRLLCSQEKEPLRILTDKLRSYSAALRTILCGVAHNTERYANNRSGWNALRELSDYDRGLRRAENRGTRAT